MKKTIIPAILTNDASDFKNKLKKAKSVADWLHIDIMDGKFVPNKSLSLRSLRKIIIPLKIEVHLMVKNPERYFLGCQKLKAKRVIWHIEGARNPQGVLAKMKRYRFQRGIALNPKTPVKKIIPLLKNADLVLLLGVTPGFQEQKLQPYVLKKITELKKISKRVKIGFDGGINPSTIQKIAKAGADSLVVGSYLVKAENIRKNFQLLQNELKK